MEAAAEARASTTPELLARQRRALKPTTGAPKTVVVTEASLRAFYEQHNPANTAPDRLKIVLQHYDGRHDKLVQDLSKRYGAAASAALCAVGQQLYNDEPRAAVATIKDDKENAPPPRRSKQLSHDADKENLPPSGKSPVKAARRRHTITSPYRPRAAPAPLRAPQRRSVDTCVPPEVEVPKTLKPKASPPVTTPSVRHVPEVSPPKVWPPSINLADRLAQAVKARFFCDAHVAATVETVSVATSPITVPGAATFVPVWNQCSYGVASMAWGRPKFDFHTGLFRRAAAASASSLLPSRSPSLLALPWAGRRPPPSPPRRLGRAGSRGRSASRPARASTSR